MQDTIRGAACVAAMLAATSLAASAAEPLAAKKFYAISLKCPSENGGVLELTLRRGDGSLTILNRTAFVAGKAKVVTLLASPANSPVVEKVSDAPKVKAADPALEEVVTNAGRVAVARNRGVCEGLKKIKRRYFAALKENLALFKKTSP